MEDNQNAASVAPSTLNEANGNGIDFSSLSSLDNRSEEKESLGKRILNALIECLLSISLFIGGFLLDILKALWQIVEGIYVGVTQGVFAIGRFFRKLSRMWREGDYGVKASFLICGFGNFKVGQIVDGVVFLLVEVIFGVFMAFRGVNNIINLIFIGETGQSIYHGTSVTLDNNSSIIFLISGLLTIVFVIAFLFVWYSSIRSAYDGYVIKHNFEFLAAKEDALHVYQNKDSYPSIFSVKEKSRKDGTSYRYFKFVSKGKVRRVMREEYGYSKLSSLYISYVPFSWMNPRVERGPAAWKEAIVNWIYKGYSKAVAKAKHSKFSSVFAKYINWHPFKRKSKYGYAPTEEKLSAALNQHRHTFDKYNLYLPCTRDAKLRLEVLSQGEKLAQAIYAEDEISSRSGIAPIARGEKVKAKSAAVRVVGAFECSYETALACSKIYLKAVKNASKTGQTAEDAFYEAVAFEQEKYDSFVETNLTAKNASIDGRRKAYQEYSELRSHLDAGKNVFLSTLVNEYHLSKADAKEVIDDYALAIKVCDDDELATDAYLKKIGEHYETVASIYDKFPFYGQPIRFKKKSKQYLDEKFAVTVLTFPVLGALIVSILPLLFSIVIAFTNYNYTNKINPNPYLTGIFDWGWNGFKSLFGLGSGTSLLPTFGYILGWTLIWAFFATFLNFIFGIILALMINNKHIKLKKMWRTIFVISIAIPQFITLLAMSIILGKTGPIHAWFAQMGWADTNTFWLNDTSHDALIPKIMLILVNCWVGIPYTMLSTSGILMNIPEDLYESARIDGATPATQFFKITLPYILFVMGPYLLTQFIGNINNFNVIYFLTGGGPASAATNSVQLQEKAQLTDLLITWLYKMTVNASQPKYATGAVLGILIFAICAFFSLIVYKRMGSTQNEEEFQ